MRDVTKVASPSTFGRRRANDNGGINFMVSQGLEKLLDGARDRRSQDARRKADIYAKGARVTVGAPLSYPEEAHRARCVRGKGWPTPNGDNARPRKGERRFR